MTATIRSGETVETGVRRFEIHSCLGKGGFGEVYRATMRSPGGLTREVAVKTLIQGGTPDAIARLRDEARLMAALNLPAVPVVHDLAMLNGRIALVTEYVPGADLSCFVRAGMPIPPKAAAEIREPGRPNPE